MTGPRVTVELPAELLEQAAYRGAQRALAEYNGEPAGWYDVEAAARYRACPESRIYDLVAQGRLRCSRDGRRLYFRREWLDGTLEDGVADR